MKVKVVMRLEYLVDVAEGSDAEDVEFYRNEGSWASSNLPNEIERAIESDELISVETESVEAV